MKHAICLLISLISINSLASSETQEGLDKKIINEFIAARELNQKYEDLNKKGYQIAEVANWKHRVDLLVNSAQEGKLQGIDLPFDRSIHAYDLYDLMQAYITGTGIEEYTAKFSLALICHENKSACEKYIFRTEFSKETLDLLGL